MLKMLVNQIFEPIKFVRLNFFKINSKIILFFFFFLFFLVYLRWKILIMLIISRVINVKHVFIYVWRWANLVLIIINYIILKIFIFFIVITWFCWNIHWWRKIFNIQIFKSIFIEFTSLSFIKVLFLFTIHNIFFKSMYLPNILKERRSRFFFFCSWIEFFFKMIEFIFYIFVSQNIFKIKNNATMFINTS